VQLEGLGQLKNPMASSRIEVLMMLRIKIIGLCDDTVKFGRWVPFQRNLEPLSLHKKAFYVLKTKAAGSFKVAVPTYQTTRCHIPTFII
jgi:hypothetical protein